MIQSKIQKALIQKLIEVRATRVKEHRQHHIMSAESFINLENENYNDNNSETQIDNDGDIFDNMMHNKMKDLISMICKSQIYKAKVLIEEDTNLLSFKDPFYCFTPLHWATRCNQFEFVQWLLKKGADPNEQSSTGQTPLHMAVIQNNGELVELFLEQCSIDVRVMDYMYQMPGDYVMASNDVNIKDRLKIPEMTYTTDSLQLLQELPRVNKSLNEHESQKDIRLSELKNPKRSCSQTTVKSFDKKPLKESMLSKYEHRLASMFNMHGYRRESH